MHGKSFHVEVPQCQLYSHLLPGAPRSDWVTQNSACVHTWGGGIFLLQSFKRVPSICRDAKTIKYSTVVYSRAVNHEVRASQGKPGTRVVGWASKGQKRAHGDCPGSICVSFVWSDSTWAAICLIQLTDVLRCHSQRLLFVFFLQSLRLKTGWVHIVNCDFHWTVMKRPAGARSLSPHSLTQRPVFNNVPIVHGLRHSCPQ